MTSDEYMRGRMAAISEAILAVKEMSPLPAHPYWVDQNSVIKALLGVEDVEDTP